MSSSLATGRTRSGYLGGLRQETMQFQLNQMLEAKLRSKSRHGPDAGEKIRLLTLNASPIDYDFVVARRTHRFGVTTNSFSYNVQSDLLPGFDFSSNYSLFQGDPLSDTAKFKPFRTGLTATFSIGKNSNPFKTLQRLFGGGSPRDTAPVGANLTGNAMTSNEETGHQRAARHRRLGGIALSLRDQREPGMESLGELHVVACASDHGNERAPARSPDAACQPFLVTRCLSSSAYQNPPPSGLGAVPRRRRDHLRDHGAEHAARQSLLSHHAALVDAVDHRLRLRAPPVLGSCREPAA